LPVRTNNAAYYSMIQISNIIVYFPASKKKESEMVKYNPVLGD